MMTWHLDRLFRSAPATTAAACGLMALVGAVIASVSEVDSVLGGLLVGAFIVGVGAVAGSILAAGAGTAMFGVIAALARPGLGWLMVAGATIVVVLFLVDLSFSTRRAPRIGRRVWLATAAHAVGVAAAGSMAAATAWLLATRTTWPAVVIPLALVALGLGAQAVGGAHRN